MNKKNKQLMWIFIVIAILLFVVIIYTSVPKLYTEYTETQSQTARNKTELEKLEKEDKKLQDRKEQEEIQLQSLKQIYQSEVTSNDSLATYGTMFDDLIRMAQAQGLLIRSIEYDMNPTFDAVYSDFSLSYNVCELKFFFVGSYGQLKNYLREITLSFPYLVSISSLNVTAFSENTDYLLIKLSVNLYSKKTK